MKVYGHPVSTCTRKVLTTLNEKNQAYEMVVVDLFKGEHKQPAHMARHPFGVIPAFEDDDGFMLYESRAIIRYLDAKLTASPLTPTNLHGRGLMEQFISVEQSYFTPAAMKIIYQLYFNKMQGKPADMAVVEQGREGVKHAMDVISKTLSKQPYLAGETFSLAEISWMPYLEYLQAAGAEDLITAHASVGDWWKRISSRPSWQKTTGK